MPEPVLLEAARQRARPGKAAGARRVGLVWATSCGQLIAASAHPSTTHTRDHLNLTLTAGLVDHCHEVHVVLGIEQTGINVIVIAPEFEHDNTVGQNQS